MIDTIRLGGRARNQLISLKRKTGIENWNILCRWAFTLSINEESRPRSVDQPLDGGIEMTWHTFAGEYDAIYEALLLQRCANDGIDVTPSELSKQLRQHLYRGIGYLAAGKRINNIADLALLETHGNTTERSSAASPTSPQ